MSPFASFLLGQVKVSCTSPSTHFHCSDVGHCPLYQMQSYLIHMTFRELPVFLSSGECHCSDWSEQHILVLNKIDPEVPEKMPRDDLRLRYSS
jgi:hypothetical protein